MHKQQNVASMFEEPKSSLELKLNLPSEIQTYLALRQDKLWGWTWFWRFLIWNQTHSGSNVMLQMALGGHNVDYLHTSVLFIIIYVVDYIIYISNSITFAHCKIGSAL